MEDRVRGHLWRGRLQDDEVQRRGPLGGGGEGGPHLQCGGAMDSCHISIRGHENTGPPLVWWRNGHVSHLHLWAQKYI
jgi:hypothetical protein